MGLSDLLYSLYERRLVRELTDVPCHVGVIVDGNRRYAKSQGKEAVGGYEAGAEKITEFLQWCFELDIEVVTFWLLSTENLQRPPEELRALLTVIENLVDQLATDERWRVQLVGSLDLLPAESVSRLKSAAERSAKHGPMTVNICVGYGGRQELADAMKSLLLEKGAEGKSIAEIAESLDVAAIADHLYTKGQPDPDLLIRTSGEQRLSGFLLWQSVYSEFYFHDAMWPSFRRVDFLRALRDYAARERRYGL